METIMNIFNRYKDVIIEVFRSSPAWIALIISIISPLLNKKLDIEKDKVNFLLSKKFEIFENHFKKLYEFRNIVIDFIAVLLQHYEHQEATNIEDINATKEQMHNLWNEIRLNEASLWLVAEYEQLRLKSSILNSVKEIFQKINSLNNEGVLVLNQNNLKEMISLAKNLQDAISNLLNEYRKILSINNN